MTGKQLKDWAATLHDDAVIEAKRISGSYWDTEFMLKATLESQCPTKAEIEASVK